MKQIFLCIAIEMVLGVTRSATGGVAAGGGGGGGGGGDVLPRPFKKQKYLKAESASTLSWAEVEGGSTEKLNLAGGTLTGHVTTTQTSFTTNQQLVTKLYVDTVVAASGGAATIRTAAQGASNSDSEVYSCLATYTKTQVDGFVDNKLDVTVASAGSASGAIDLWQVVGNQLRLKPVTGAGLASVSESGGVVTVTAQADSTKANVAHTHPISEITNLQTELNNKASASHTHPISEITNLQTELNNKAAASHTHPISEITNLQTELNNKAAASHTHAISEITNLQTELNNKASTIYVDTQITNLVDSAPGALDTLNELAAALNDDANFSTTVTNSIAGKLPLTGGALSGDVTTSVGSFTSSSLVPKSFVDSAVSNLIDDTQHTTTSVWSSSNTRNEIIGRVGSLVSKTYPSTQNIASVVTTSQSTFTLSNQFVTKSYVDTANAGQLSLTGGALSGDITTSNSSFTSSSLVPKSYVDTATSSLIDDSTVSTSTLYSSTKIEQINNNLLSQDTSINAKFANHLELVGGALTGHVTTNQATFNSNDQLVSKAYVDTGLSTKLDSSKVVSSTSTTSGEVYDVTHLNTELAGKANTSHTHAISDVTSLQTTLDSKLPLTGGALTGHVTTNQTTFSNTNLVTKLYVDGRFPTDVNTPVSYTTTNTVADQNYVFGIAPAGNAMALVEIPKVYTGVPASSRSVRVGFDGGDYGSGSVSVGYEALKSSIASPGMTNNERTVAIGYQAGYHTEATKYGIYIGPYQGYQNTTSNNQLKIGNSGVSQGTTGYDKAIIEGTMATTDAGQTLRLNADTIYLGSSIPTSQPGDNRLWLSNGSLSIGAVSGGGGVASHTHPISDITSLQTELNNRFLVSNVVGSISTTAGQVYDVVYVNSAISGRAAASHTHAISDITNLQTELNNKVNTSLVKNASSTTAGDVYDVRHVNTELAGKAPTTHSHVIGDVTNLQTELNNKLNTSAVVSSNSTTASEVYNVVYVNTELAGKAPTTHSHVIGDVTNLQTELNNRFLVSDVVSSNSTTAGQVYDVVYVNSAISGRAAASHTHPISEITNLQTELNNKVNTSVVKSNNSTTAGDVYDVRYVNTELLAINSALSNVAASSHTHPISDITNLQTELNNKVNTSVVKNANSTTAGDVYDVRHVNTELTGKLNLSGGSLTGTVTTSETSFANQDLVTKLYVDNAVSSGGGSSFTANFTPSTMYGKVNRTAMVTMLAGSNVVLNGTLANESNSVAASGVGWYFNSSATVCINEFTIWVQYTTAGSTGDNFRNNVCEIYGSNSTSDTSAPPSGNWVRLNPDATVWLAEATSTPSLMWTQYSQLYPQGFRFKCNSNVANYNRYWIKPNFAINPMYDITWNYAKDVFSSSTSLPLAGGSLTGTVTTSETSFANQDLVTKLYVDTAVAGAGGGGGTTTSLPSYPFNASGPTDNTLQYIGIGNRMHHMRVWAEGVGGGSNTYMPNVMTHVNGARNDSGNGFGALNMPVGSSVVYSWEDGSAYPFTKMTWQMHWPLGTPVSNSGMNFHFLIGGSNDNVNWTWLGAFSPDNHSWTPPAPFASVTNYTNSGNYTATSTNYYTSNTVSSASGSAYARTFHFTNTTGYRMYRIKILDNAGSSVYNTNGGNRNLYVEFAEIEWG